MRKLMLTDEERIERKRKQRREDYVRIRARLWKSVISFKNRQKATSEEELKQRKSEYGKRYYQKYLDRIKAGKLKWRRENPEAFRQKNWQYRQNANKEKRRATGREYYQKNRKNLVKKSVLWQAKKRKMDSVFAFYCRIRTRVRQCLKKNAPTNRPRTIELFGCTVRELRDYIESKFQSGMTWDNWGRKGWHIDHIRPCSTFNLIDPLDQRRCFHYTNLQPLWEPDNIRKADTVPDSVFLLAI